MIDLRSDTVTQPTAEMKAAMVAAPLGDDVFGDDPTVHQLQDLVAGLLGKDAALFVPSGTQSNLCALLAHCGRGDEYIVGDSAHTYRWEGGGAAVLGSVQPQTVPMLEDGLLDPDAIAAAVKPDDAHFARTKLVTLENTKDGKVQTIERMKAATSVARAHGLSTHLDGARMFNAVVALDADPAEFVAEFDTVSVCLSKGLGAPMGSVLAGSTALIAEAHKWRKMLGGGLRQAGMIAAAGIHALDNHVDRLTEDHDNAARLAAGLREINGVDVTAHNTNMVFITAPGHADTWRSALHAAGIATLWSDAGNGRAGSRLVTHLDVSGEDVDEIISQMAKFGPGASAG